jgi:hypothetical protein
MVHGMEQNALRPPAARRERARSVREPWSISEQRGPAGAPRVHGALTPLFARDAVMTEELRRLLSLDRDHRGYCPHRLLPAAWVSVGAGLPLTSRRSCQAVMARYAAAKHVSSNPLTPSQAGSKGRSILKTYARMLLVDVNGCYGVTPPPIVAARGLAESAGANLCVQGLPPDQPSLGARLVAAEA